MKTRYLCKAKKENYKNLPKNAQWTQGYYVYFPHSRNHCIYTENHGLPIVHNIDVFTLCQCTGTNDTQNIMIWENDLVKDCFDHIGIVKYDVPDNDHHVAAFLIVYPNGSWVSLSDTVVHNLHITVIGSTIDNPDLSPKRNE